MFEKLIDEIKKSSKIYVCGHINPDGDSIGSTYAMYLALKKLDKNVLPIISKYSKTFSFLPNIDDGVATVIEEEFDLLICVDSSSKSRLAISEEDYNKAKKVVMIDHHIEDKAFGDINIINSNLPAASELVYDFINELGIKIDKKIASYLYMGLITDTGSFNYSSTKPSTLIAASKLMDVGIDFTDICKRVNDTVSEAKLHLIQKAIENMEVYFDGQVRYTFIDYNQISSLGIDDEDAEGMTNYLRMVENTEVAIYVRERSTGELKVSMRSNGKVDLSDVAIKFLGGGHKRAAGFSMDIINSTYEKEKEKLLDYIGVRLNDDFAG